MVKPTTFSAFNTIKKIQDFLDQADYNTTHETRSPKWVISLKRAHCVEGAMFAAACLRRLGHRPLILDMQAVNDDDHVIAVFRKDNRWGAIAKSNFTTLRMREPVYKNLRELVMSYFDFFFNSLGEKTLRAYSLPLDLSRFDKNNWETTDDDLTFISDHLDHMRHYPLLNKDSINRLTRVPEYLLKAGLMGSDPKGLYKPETS